MAITAAASHPIDALSSTRNSAATPPAQGAAAPAKADTSATDRFLKLLVTQMKNQDPLNPMDNAQVTSQMAQISTVSGIQDLNATMAGMNAGFTQMQALQGAALVGHDVTLAGNRLDVDASGGGVGGFEIASAADSVKVEIFDAAGSRVSAQDLGAQPAGMNGFAWPEAQAGTRYSFKVTATAAGTTLAPTPLMRDRVSAVSIVNNQLTLQTVQSGPVAYANVKAVS